jgi:hypothetical protein
MQQVHRRKKLWPDQIVVEAKRLRELGATYSEIGENLGVGKSTLHYWLKGFRLSPQEIKELRRKLGKNMQPAGARASHDRKVKRNEETKERIACFLDNLDVNNRQLTRAIFSMLYWSEGSKGGGSLTFANTDPKLCKLYIKLLRDSYHIDEKKIRVRVHVHYYHIISSTFKFWSNLLNVPLSQFGKPYIKPRSKIKKYRENFAGICFIKYHSTSLKEEVMQTAYQLADKICI